MKKILVGVFVVIILSVGVLGYNEINNSPVKVIEDNNHSTTITS
ncbi:hypothetical protein [Virgibacillus ainsalahensis]